MRLGADGPILPGLSPRFPNPQPPTAAAPELGLRPSSWVAAPQELRLLHPHPICFSGRPIGPGLAGYLHAGGACGKDLALRRANDRQCRVLLRLISGRLAAFLGRISPWERRANALAPWPRNLAGNYISPYFSRRTWSLTESRSPIELALREYRSSGCS